VILPTASSLQRVMACPGSWSEKFPIERQEVSDAMERGSGIHKYLENYYDRKDNLFDGVAEKFHDFCASISLAHLPSQIGLSEQAYAYNPATRLTKSLGKIDRKYPLEQNIFYGTADYVGWSDRSIPLVIDFKTGQADVPDPKDNWQLRMLAVAVGRIYQNAPGVDVGITKIRDDASVFTVTHFYSRNDLELFEGMMIGTMALLQEGRQEFRRGDHCKYCPAFAYCPIQTAMLRNLVSNPERFIEEEVIKPLKNDDRAEAYQNYRRIRMAMQRMEAAIRQTADATPIELPDGTVYGPVSRTIESVDGEVAFAALEEKYGNAVALRACSFEVSKASVERAMAEIAPKGKKAAYVREAMAEIANSGGIKIETRTELRETKKKS
jgi:hypothetical protein